ncbi:MAG: mechanosensitive ion channel family protein [Weeksellaceae bacterium]
MDQSILTNIYVQNIAYTIAVLVILLPLSRISQRLVAVVLALMTNRVMSAQFMSKTKTIRSLLRYVIDTFLWVMALLLILSKWGINIIPLLTGAGIAGLALSFGSQTLVKDIISGLFIVIENQYNVGDTVQIGAHKGVVERMTLRLTMLRDTKENKIYIPNSQVLSVVRLKTKATKKK